MDLSRTFYKEDDRYVCRFCGFRYAYDLAIYSYCDICHRCLDTSQNGNKFYGSGEPCCKCDFVKNENGEWIEVENNRTGGVYFIKCGNAVKIGKTNDIKKRLDGLQTANPEKLELLSVIKTANKEKAEKDIHNYFKHLRIRNEWFHFNDEIMDFLKTGGLF